MKQGNKENESIQTNRTIEDDKEDKIAEDFGSEVEKEDADDSKKEYVPPAKNASLVRAKRGRKPTNSCDSEPVLKKAKTVVYEKPSNNNEDKAASEKVSNVEVKKESVEEITKCRCDECPELVKNNKIKTLLDTSSTDSNSNLIVQLKEILNPVNESLGEYVEEEEDDAADIKTEPVTVKTELIKTELEDDIKLRQEGRRRHCR